MAAMIPIASGVKVWIATGHTDMRCDMNSLALLVQEDFKRDPHVISTLFAGVAARKFFGWRLWRAAWRVGIRWRMSFWTIRRISALLMALLLTVGLVAPSFGAPDVVVKSTVTVTNDMPMSSDMPGKCNGCASHEKSLAAATCSSVLCGSVTVLPSLTVVLSTVPGEALKPADEPNASGRAVPPDPHPPRTAILS